ncbi:quinol:cytochrome C oxidoreductase [Mucilaginibacter sp. RS28]|uniref:Quinol:cytochrome C oxidoreductase n=1 Tax=Mucilaginibacter straminoryzae TaxID=2932774 RepID=A0A9X1X601_9SPHI|nr:quinol:cytochrome C oxidoreductase [Mucilaginibacter straminoryzae]MCJ8211601.1 quinol:cytochrome C oxidoreductase [Mucilaginibacter straminoryzae]
MKTEYSFNERFEFAGKAKTWSLIAIAIGIIGLIIGFLDKSEGGMQRTFNDLLLGGYYFVCVCICGVFFMAYQYAAQSGWSVSFLRIPQAFAKVLPIAAVVFIIIVTAGLFTKHEIVEEGKKVMAPYLYAHWATPGLTDPKSENYDAIIAGKSAFLNIPFFYGVVVILLALYALFGRMLVKYSENEDELGGMLNYNKSFKAALIFLVVFGFTYPVFAFDAIMSVEAHWFSTMFGWYNLAALHVAGLAVITLTVLLLHQSGYLGWVNENHIHDLAKSMFAFSIFWTYVWFAQFFLIWYANLPEESVYFYHRWQPEYKWWFWLNIVLNFVSPLLLLMSRDSKRYYARVKFTCVVLIIGHWLDYYLMIMPGTMPERNSYIPFGIQDVLIFVGFAGLFTFLMLQALSKFKSLIPSKHPFVQESLHHHI